MGRRRHRRPGRRCRPVTLRGRPFPLRRRLELLGRRIGFLEAIEIAEVLSGFFRRRGGGWIRTGRRRGRDGCRVRGRWRRIRDRAYGGRVVGNGYSLGTDAAADEDAQQKDDDRHDGRRHEQEYELFPVQLNLVKALVR